MKNDTLHRNGEFCWGSTLMLLMKRGTEGWLGFMGFMRLGFITLGGTRSPLCNWYIPKGQQWSERLT